MSRGRRLADGSPVPRIPELLEALPHARIAIDIKADAALGPMIRLLHANPAWMERVCLGSFSDARLIGARRRLGPALCTSTGPAGVLAHRMAAAVRRPTPTRYLGNCLQVPAAVGRLTVVTRAFVEAAHEQGRPVHVWTVDDPTEMERLLDLGVDGIMTDRPEILRSVLISRGQWPHPAEGDETGPTRRRFCRERHPQRGGAPDDARVTSHIPAAVTDDQRRREQRGWFFYDWAASAFSTTVVTVFMGPYLTTVTEDAAGPGGFVTFLGIRVRDSAWFPAMITTSVLIQVFLLPVVGAVADRARSKRVLLALFAGIGSVATMLMFFVRDGHFEVGGLLLVVANIAFGASIVVYNAFLPEIATPDERDSVSARGWALGYLGGFILLLLNLVLFTAHDSFGLTEGEAVRLCLLSAGVWWALFTTIPLRRLVDRPPAHLRDEPGDGARASWSSAFRQLRHTLSDLRNYPH